MQLPSSSQRREQEFPSASGPTTASNSSSDERTEEEEEEEEEDCESAWRRGRRVALTYYGGGGGGGGWFIDELWERPVNLLPSLSTVVASVATTLCCCATFSSTVSQTSTNDDVPHSLDVDAARPRTSQLPLTTQTKYKQQKRQTKKFFVQPFTDCASCILACSLELRCFNMCNVMLSAITLLCAFFLWYASGQWWPVLHWMEHLQWGTAAARMLPRVALLTLCRPWISHCGTTLFLSIVLALWERVLVRTEQRCGKFAGAVALTSCVAFTAVALGAGEFQHQLCETPRVVHTLLIRISFPPAHVLQTRPSWKNESAPGLFANNGDTHGAAEPLLQWYIVEGSITSGTTTIVNGTCHIDDGGALYYCVEWNPANVFTDAIAQAAAHLLVSNGSSPPHMTDEMQSALARCLRLRELLPQCGNAPTACDRAESSELPSAAQARILAIVAAGDAVARA